MRTSRFLILLSAIIFLSSCTTKIFPPLQGGSTTGNPGDPTSPPKDPEQPIHGGGDDDGGAGGSGGPGEPPEDSTAMKSVYLANDSKDDDAYTYDSAGPEATGYSPSPGYKPIHRADINGDGTMDLIWKDSSGNVAGTIIAGTEVIQSGTIGTTMATMRLVDAVDTNGDGKDDLIWQDTLTLQITIWNQNGLSKTTVSVAGLGWTALGVGKFSSTGDNEIFLLDLLTGAVSLGHIDTFPITSLITRLLTLTGLTNDLAFVGIQDLTSDGLDEVLWMKSSDRSLIRAKLTDSTADFVAIANSTLPTQATVEALRDLTEDGKIELLWQSRPDFKLHTWTIEDSSISAKKDNVGHFVEDGWFAVP